MIPLVAPSRILDASLMHQKHGLSVCKADSDQQPRRIEALCSNEESLEGECVREWELSERGNGERRLAGDERMRAASRIKGGLEFPGGKTRLCLEEFLP
ncbi:hypothetical protein KM043_003159 [Ampulex compressa]|nr:hypothetical protein KM043_003159 [Ampulex compressa]